MSDSYTTKAGRLIQLLGFITLAMLLVAGAFVIVNRLLTAQPIPASAMAAFALGIVLAAVYLIVGTELTKHKRWARALAWVIGVLALFNFPIGTIIGAFVLYYLVKARHEPAPAGQRA